MKNSKTIIILDDLSKIEKSMIQSSISRIIKNKERIEIININSSISTENNKNKISQLIEELRELDYELNETTSSFSQINLKKENVFSMY